ncbi:MAG: hypothetical protein ABIR04_05570 [Cypionkella sp.]
MSLHLLRERIEAKITFATNSHLRGELLGAREILNKLVNLE